VSWVPEISDYDFPSSITLTVEKGDFGSNEDVFSSSITLTVEVSDFWSTEASTTITTFSIESVGLGSYYLD